MLSRIVVQAEDCDLLVMDEPTSHLDINTVEWLEDYLLKTHCSVLVISHDRYFLDKIATRMLEIDHGKSREYKGNYSDFIMKKMLDLDRMEKEYRKYASQKRRQEEIAKELHRDQWYATTHKTREKMIEKGINTPYTSSAGRLFDAISALLGVCLHPTYEGEAAILLDAIRATCPF